MKTQVWPIAELQRLDRETRKILVESGVKQGSTELLYLPRSVRGTGGGGVGAEYKITKIKADVNIKGNTYSTMGLVREFEEKVAQVGGRSVVKDEQTFAEELWMDLKTTVPRSNQSHWGRR